MPNSSPASDTPGLRKGRACRHCARLKEKCLPLDDTLTICRRCHRLGKVCSTASLPARKAPRTTHKTTGHPSPALTPLSCTTLFTTVASTTTQDAVQEDKSDPSPTLSGLAREVQIKLFDHFWNDISPYFPFLTKIISNCENGDEDYTYENVRQTSPFTTAACLMTALHRQTPVRKVVARELLVSISNAILLESRKSLDLLQCIVIIEAWYPYHMMRTPQMNNLLYLAQSMAIDLNLAKYDAYTGLANRIWPDVGAVLFGSAQGPWSGLAEHRLILALHYLQAMYAVSLRRLEFPRWNKRFDNVIQYLEERGEQSTDLYAVRIARVLKVASRYLVPDGIRPSASFNVRIYSQCFSDEISAVLKDLPPALSDNIPFMQDVRTIELALRDLILKATDDTSTSSAERTEAFHSTHALISSFFDHLLTLPLDSYPLTTTITMGSQISQALEVLIKLHCMSSAENHSPTLPEEEDHLVGPSLSSSSMPPNMTFAATAERIAERFEEVYLNERQLFPHLETGSFAMYAIKARQWKKRFQEMLAACPSGSDGRQQQGVVSSNARSTNAGGRGGVGAVSTDVTANPDGTAIALMSSPRGFQLDDFMQWPSPFEDFGWP